LIYGKFFNFDQYIIRFSPDSKPTKKKKSLQIIDPSPGKHEY